MEDKEIFNRSTIDIRFDAFKNESGKLKMLYDLTKGKKNEEAFEALNCWEGRIALFNLAYEDYFSTYEDKGYKNNFFASTIYLKDTDTLLIDSDKVFYSYYACQNYLYDEDGNPIYHEDTGYEYTYSDERNITAKDLSFARKENGFFNYLSLYTFVNPSYNDYAPYYVCYSYTKTTEELLDFLFSCCNIEGEKEFRLTAFKDDEKYGILYSELTDLAALEWLASDLERLSYFAKAAGLVYAGIDFTGVYSFQMNNNYYNSDDVLNSFIA